MLVGALILLLMVECGEHSYTEEFKSLPSYSLPPTVSPFHG